MDSSRLCHLLRISSRLETWALSSVCAHTTCAGPHHVIFMSNQLSVFMKALLQLGNYSAHIHQAHIFMSFMRNYWDKTRSYCKCAWLWNLHQNSPCVRALKQRNSFFIPKMKSRKQEQTFYYFQTVLKALGLSVHRFTVKSLHWHYNINDGN